MRAGWTLVHRYVGLVMAVVLIIAGVTGALLAWLPELDAGTGRDIRTIPASSARSPVLDGFTLRERVNTRLPCAHVDAVDLRPFTPNVAVSMSPTPGIDRRTGKPCQLNYDELFVDPATGQVVGHRRWGVLSEGFHNLMPFIYRLHYELALGVIGHWAFGVIAVLWTLDCFIGAYLTFPRRSRRTNASGWSRWRKAWTVRWSGGSIKLNFDLHRAGGLWPWALLLVFAWSSVSLNLNTQVYKPVMSALSLPVSERGAERPALAEPLQHPPIQWRNALELGRAIARREGQRMGFAPIEDIGLSYDAATGTYTSSVRTSRDIRDRAVFSSVSFDARTGALTHLYLPTGRHAGDTITMWLWALHLADIWGMPYRIVVSVIGVTVAMLSYTGVVIWWKKRKARGHARARAVTHAE